MITSSQNVDDTNLDTVYLLVSGGRKGNKNIISIMMPTGLQVATLWFREKSRRMVFTLYFVFNMQMMKRKTSVHLCTSFKNYNKSKELMERHAKDAYHIRAVNHAFEFTRR